MAAQRYEVIFVFTQKKTELVILLLYTYVVELVITYFDFKMGCGGTKVYHVNENIDGQGPDTLHTLKKLCLSENDINILYTAFKEFDITGDDNVGISEFLVMLNVGKVLKHKFAFVTFSYLFIEETPVSREVFSEFDRSRDKQMNFKEFSCSIWRFCTLNKREVAAFAFSIYDTDDSGTFSVEEITQMITEVYGSKGLNENTKKILKNFDVGNDGTISQKDFIDHAEKYPALLFPAYSFQVFYI